MKLFTSILLSLVFINPSHAPAKADWRWAKPNIKVKKFKAVCNSTQCHKAARVRTKENHKARIKYYNARKLAEWNSWTHLPIPDCTWYGESGTGPQFARYRYTLPNSTGSGAYGKYQFMSTTYHDVAKYHDWSPLDQEIAGHREYWKLGTQPWSNCG